MAQSTWRFLMSSSDSRASVRQGVELGEVGGVHVTRHVGLLLEFGLQECVLHHTDPNVHLNNLLPQFGQTLPYLHHRCCTHTHRRGQQQSHTHAAHFSTLMGDPFYLRQSCCCLFPPSPAWPSLAPRWSETQQKTNGRGFTVPMSNDQKWAAVTSIIFWEVTAHPPATELTTSPE